MPTIPLNDIGKGVNKDLLPAELGAGVWSDAVNFRFRNGFAERFDGLAVANSSGYNNTYWIDSHADATVRYVFAGGSDGKTYMFSGVYTDVTRYADTIIIASITRVGTTATLTTTANHGRTTGDSVEVYGASPSQYNGTFTITVTGATTFTYTMGSDPGASASPVGAYVYLGSNPNFTADSGAGLQRWTGGSLNGVYVVNHPVDGLYYWPGSGTRLRRFPQSYVSDSARIFKNYVVQLARTVNGTKFQHNVAWSAAAEPGSIPASFDASSTNDAGDVDLAETPGAMVDCLPLGDANIIYKQDARYAMTYIGGNDVFRFQRLPGNDGLMFRDCVVNTPVGHVFLTQSGDVMVHQGGEARSIARGRIENWIRTNYDFAVYKARGYLALCPEKSEVWVCIPKSEDSGFPYTIAAWNWENDTWGTFVLESGVLKLGLRFTRAGLWTSGTFGNEYRLISSFGVALYTLDPLRQGKFVGNVLTSTLERTGLHFDDRDQFKTLHRSRWNIDGTAGKTATISHGSSKTADGTVTYATSATYTIGTTDYVDARATKGRFCAIKLVTTSDAAFSVRSADLDVTAGGKR